MNQNASGAGAAARSVVVGRGRGDVLSSSVPLSFMGGVDPASGLVIDVHHPLCGQSVAGKVLVLPSGRGSCAGSGVLLELLLGRRAPAALVFTQAEPILCFGVVLSAELFGISIPVVEVDEATHLALRDATGVVLTEDRLEAKVEGRTTTVPLAPVQPVAAFVLSEHDENILNGVEGPGAQVAMRLVIRAAQLEGASRLLDVTRAHIDGCFYQGPASVRFAERLHELGAAVRVPSTMNALCIDRRRWRDQGVPDEVGLPSERIADLHVTMGVRPTYTCAPYLLDPPPAPGERIAWGESNAVVYANAVLGAHTLKYPDYLDLLVAIVGRAPDAGAYTTRGRRPTIEVCVRVPPHAIDDVFWPVLGYHLGSRFPNDIPLVTGLENSAATDDDLRAFGAAYATTSASALFHIASVTYEARHGQASVADDALPPYDVSATDLRATWDELNPDPRPTADLVALGNPHFSLAEYRRLASLCRGVTKHEDVRLVVTAGRDVHDRARRAGLVEQLETFGAEFVADTCWCLIGEPVIGNDATSIVTNSGKYAHYGPAATGRSYQLRNLADCVAAAVTTQIAMTQPPWLATTASTRRHR